MFYQYVHNLRGLAILLVISAHVISVVPFSNSEFADVVRSFLRNCTVIFVLIGGWLFSYLVSKYTYKSYLVNKLQKVVIPYMVISLPALAIYLLGYKSAHPWVDLAALKESYGLIGQTLYFLFTGAHLGPLWFMPMVFLFYLAFPIFKALSSSRYLPLVIVLALIPALYLGRPLANDNTLQSFFYFLPVWLMGMAIFHHKVMYQSLSRYFYLYFFCFLVLLTSIYFIWEWDSRVDLLLKIAIGVMLFSGFYRLANSPNRFLGLMADLSFYLFFIHGYFIAVFRALFTKFTFLPQDILGFIIVFILMLSLSVMSFYCFRFFLKSRTGTLLGAYR